MPKTNAELIQFARQVYRRAPMYGYELKETADALDAAGQALAKSQVAAEKATAISIRNIDARKEVQAQLIKTEAALVGEKARVDIAERRSIAAGAQAEALQAQVIDLKAALRTAANIFAHLKMHGDLEYVRSDIDEWLADDAASK